MPRPIALLPLLILATACHREPQAPLPGPPPEAPPARAPEAMRPLTSREGGAPRTLPSGHPPLGAGSVASGAAISGTVDAAANLRTRISPNDTLFVIARNAGTHEVVAVHKEEHATLPLRFSLSAADVMREGTPFRGPFDLTVRVSKSGDAMPKPGDLEGTVRGVADGASAVTVTIDSVRQ